MTAATNRVDLWVARLNDPRWLAGVDRLDSEEVGRAGRFRTHELRGRYVASHVALRTVLADYEGLPPGSMRFDRTCLLCGHAGHGRPRLVGGGVEFNLSHGGELCVIAVSKEPVGADVEALGRRFPAERLVRRTTTDREWDALHRLAGEPRHQAFLELWCRKEAYVKGIGTGITVPFGDIEVGSDDDGPAPVIDRRPGGASGWQVASRVLEGHVCATATVGPFELDLRWT
jgi:4'-phosphopantetheinyl transferase